MIHCFAVGVQPACDQQEAAAKRACGAAVQAPAITGGILSIVDVYSSLEINPKAIFLWR